MKKLFNKYLFLLCVAFGALIFSSCSKDDDAENDNSGPVINPDKNIPDPKGTITMNMMVGAKDNSVSIRDLGTIQINNAYNFKGDGCSFVSLGKIKGLGNVTAIPQDGWNSSVAVNPGEGYVVGYMDYGLIRYARLYVVSEIAGTSGGVIGYTIKCQAPFVPFAPKFTESSLEFGADEIYTSKKLTLVNLTSVTVKSKPNWCRVYGTVDGFYVSVYSENGIYARLYVVSEIAGTSGGVIGYTIKCQAPFVPFAPKFTESSLEFGADEIYTSKKLTLVNLTSVTVKSKPNWCRVYGTVDGFYVSVYSENGMDAERSGIIEFENAEGSTSVSIKQQKKSDNPEF